jgi:mannose/cellobiose epimerase-like protein (N-acyl-D-glucosamine 2-epimerase family)
VRAEPSSSTTSWRDLGAHNRWLEQEAARLLAFARPARVEPGFGWLDAQGRPDPGMPLQLWINARMTHVFALGHLLGYPGCGPLVDHGLEALRDSFEDREHGGWFADASNGAALERPKEAYPHAFVLLAASSGVVADREPASALLERAIDVVERRFWSEDEGACLEGWDQAWTQAEGYRGANANMHMVEAFLAAGDATADTAWFERAGRITERLIREVASAHDWRVVEHFDEQWRPLPTYNADEPRHPFRPFGITPGHGLEWSRLLLQVHASLPARPPWLLEAAQGLFARAVADGWDPSGGFVYTTDLDGRPVVTDRLHWVVTEAIGAAATLHAATQAPEYERWYRTFWDFAELYLIDRERGSWHAELDEALKPSEQTWKGKPDVYHAIQATLIPRLPIAPSVAGALRDASLT